MKRIQAICQMGNLLSGREASTVSVLIFKMPHHALRDLQEPTIVLDKNRLKIIQITDAHLFGKDELIFGVNSNKHFLDVIARIEKDELKNTDAIFLTGDLSQDESPMSYTFLANAINKWNIDVCWLPGNHDSVATMTSAFSNFNKFVNTTDLITTYWHFVFVNTKKDNSDNGYVSTEELRRLTDTLENSNSANIAIVMHHHPVNVGTPLIDQFGIDNSEALLSCLKHPNVKLIICGHVHGDYSFAHQHFQIETAPATCLQWQKGTSQLTVENKIGYKIYYFEETRYTTDTKIWRSN